MSVLVVVPLKTDLFKSKVETTNLNPLVSAEFEQNKKAVDEGVKIEQVKTEENVSPVIEEQPKTEVAEPVVAEANVYFLITGSFKSEENAISPGKYSESRRLYT